MKFEIIRSGKAENIEEQYSISERTFDCKPSVNTDINVAVAYLCLGVDSDDMRVKCLWGFSPKDSWIATHLIKPDVEEGALRLVGEYEAGLTWRIDWQKRWIEYYDKRTGWFCIGNPLVEKSDKAVQIIKNMIIVVDNASSLKAVWIQPVFVKS